MPEATDSLETLIHHLSTYYPHEPEVQELTQSLIQSTQSLTYTDFIGLLGEAYSPLCKDYPFHPIPHQHGRDLYVERWRSYKLLLLLTQTSSNPKVRQIPSKLSYEGSPSKIRTATFKFYQDHSITQDGKTFIQTYSRLFFQPESVAALPEDP